MIEIRPEQFERLEAAAVREFERRAIAHLREDLPDFVGDASDDELRPMIAEGVRRAQRHGLESEFEVVCYLDTALMLQDFDFDRRAAYREILADRTVGSDVRAERLVERAAEEIGE